MGPAAAAEPGAADAMGAAAPAEAAAAAEAEAAAVGTAFLVDLLVVCANAGAITKTGTTRAAQSVLSQRILDPFFRLPVRPEEDPSRGRHASMVTRAPVYSAGSLKCNV